MTTPAAFWSYANPSADRDAYAYLRGCHTSAVSAATQLTVLTATVNALTLKVQEISNQVETVYRVVSRP